MIQESICLLISLAITIVIVFRPTKMYFNNIIKSYIRYIKKNIEIEMHLYKITKEELWSLIKELKYDEKKKHLVREERKSLVNDKKKKKNDCMIKKEKENVSCINEKNRSETLQVETKKIKEILIEFLELETKKIKRTKLIK